MLQNELIGNTLGAIMNVSLSFIVLVSIFLLLFVYAWRTTKGKSVALLLSFLVSGLIYAQVVEIGLYQKIFTESIQGFTLNIIVYCALSFGVLLLVRSYVKGLYPEETPTRFAYMGLFALVTEGLLISQAYALLEIRGSYQLSAPIEHVFGHAYSSLGWTLAALLLLFIIRTRK